MTKNSEIKPDVIVGYEVGLTNQAPFFIMETLKLHEKYNLNIEFIHFNSPNYARQAIATNKVDILSSGTVNFFDLIEKGIPLKIISPVSSSPTYIFVRPNDINYLSDLNNLSVASSNTSSSAYSLNFILDEIDLNINVVYEDIDKTNISFALMKQKIVSAVLTGSHNINDFEKMGAIILPEWKEKGFIDRYFLRTSIGVNSDFLNNNEDIVENFLNAYIDSYKFIVNYPDESLEIIKDFQNKYNLTDYSIDDIKKSLYKTEFKLWVDYNEILVMANNFKRINNLETKFMIDDLFDRRFEEKLKTAQYEVYKN